MDEHPLMQYLDFTYSSFGQPESRERILKVPVREFHVAEGFPNISHETIFKNGFLILENVQSSIRTVYEYATTDRDEFKPSYTIDDGPFSDDQIHGNLYEIDLSGPSYAPDGWVEWEVVAENVSIEGGEIIRVFE